MIQMNTKVCSKCKMEKPLEEFWKDSSRKSGYQDICKKCRNDKRSQNRRLLGIKPKKHFVSSNIGFKICIKCENEKPLADFHKCKSSKDGLQLTCKECRKKLDQERAPKRKEQRRLLHPPVIKDFNPTHKICTKCGIDKPIENFSKDSRLKGGKTSCCKDCGKKYRDKNIERDREQKKKYHSKPEV